MPSSNSRGGRNSNRSRNNNPTGRNQYSGGVMDVARERPFAAAATAVGAAAAGLFLWSKRSQISDQLSNLSDQIGEWSENMRGGQSTDFTSGSGAKSQSEVAEEAMTLKSTGRKAKRPSDPTIDEQTKAGAVAY
jgi:hypothetical protein